MFRGRGYQATRIETIAELASVAPATVYNYFTSRIEAFDVEMDNSASELIDYFIKRSARGKR